MREEWKFIPEYEGLYQISSFGRVRSVDRKVVHKDGVYHVYKGRALNYYSVRGYKYVALSKNNKVKKYRIHRLVAEAFIPNPNNLPEVNHKDEDKSNNRADNLEWCDRWYNAHYGTAISRRCSRETPDDVKCKISKALKGHYVSDETKKKISEALKKNKKRIEGEL